MKKTTLLLSVIALSVSTYVLAKSNSNVSDEVISNHRMNLEKNTAGKGFGPQAPRNIDSAAGTNPIKYGHAPAYTQMNLCNIHIHKNAEHAGGEFSKYAGNGDGKGYQTGYIHSQKLSEKELNASGPGTIKGKHGGLVAGDTIEIHYVHSSANITPGPTLGACLSDSIKNPQLRVEAQVFVLVNDSSALDFVELTKHGVEGGYQQATNIPNNMGKPIVYTGSTTGPSYNEAGSPFQVTWSVRPKVAKVNIGSLAKWFEGNAFNEDHAHGVRNLVINPALLSPIN